MAWEGFKTAEEGGTEKSCRLVEVSKITDNIESNYKARLAKLIHFLIKGPFWSSFTYLHSGIFENM